MGPCVVEEAEGLQGLAKEVLEVHEGQGQMHRTVQEVQEPEEAKVEEGVQRKGLLQKETRFQGLEEEAPCVVEEAEGLQGLAKEVLEVHEGQGQMHQTVQEVQEPEEAKVEEGVQRKGLLQKKRRRAWLKKRKAYRVLRKKCWKCMRGKVKCTKQCKKFKNRRKPKSRKACKGKACYRRKRAFKAWKKRRRAWLKKRKAYRVLRKKCWKCMRGKAKCTKQCKKFKNRRKPK